MQCVVGLFSYLWIMLKDGVIEIGYIVFGVFMQCILGFIEVVYLFVEFVFGCFGYCCLEWKCNVGNVCLMCVVECLGFIYEGIFCQYMVVKQCNCDIVWFFLFDSEWLV